MRALCIGRLFPTKYMFDVVDMIVSLSSMQESKRSALFSLLKV